MKRIFISMLSILLLLACKEKEAVKTETVEETIAYNAFGGKITDEGAITKEKMAEKFANLKEGDTLSVKFATKINEVCKAKGCWMKLDLGDQKESMVKFTDYSFFVPLDSDNKDVVVDGRAYVTKVSVEQLQHYAKDAGKSVTEIAQITEPEFTYAFEADGVLIKQ